MLGTTSEVGGALRDVFRYLHEHSTLEQVAPELLTGEVSLRAVLGRVRPAGASARELLSGPEGADPLTTQRSLSWATAPVWTVRRAQVGQIAWPAAFVVEGRTWYPCTDFLTAGRDSTADDKFGPHNTHDALPRAAKLSDRATTLVDRGYNAIYLYTSNHGDYGGNHVNPYSGSGTSGDWGGFGGTLNTTTVQAWDSRLRDLAEQRHLRPVIWLFADESSVVSGAPFSQRDSYIRDIAAAFKPRQVLWVLGLEVDEYWTGVQQVRDMRDACRAHGLHPLGVHLRNTTASKLNTHLSFWAGFDFVMLQMPKNQDDNFYRDLVSTVCDAVAVPVVAAEFNQDPNAATEARSKQIGVAVASVQAADGRPRLSGIGNGVTLGGGG